MDSEKRPHEDERIRKIIMEAHWKQTKRSMKVIFYFLIAFFAVSGGLVIFRWLF